MTRPTTPGVPVRFALRSRDLWWILATPVYYFLGLLRHEASHALAAMAMGGRVVEFSLLPTKESFGHVRISGGRHEWVWVAAPYLCDLIVFAIGYIWIFRNLNTRRWLFNNVLAVMLVSPLVDLAFNYRGTFRHTFSLPQGSSDAAFLAYEFGGLAVHAAFIAALLICAMGLARVLTRPELPS